jgi:TolB-like protein
MPTHRRARRKSIAGNITDVQKRLRFLETRPAPSKLASKAVATKNIALRAIETELIADSSITTRTVGQAQITNFTLSSVTDPEGAAVDTENIADGAVENAQLAGNISDDKISGMSSSKLIGQVQDSQIAGLSTTKLIGTITNAQLAGSITEDKIVSLPTTKLTGTITNAQLAGSITEDKITSLPTTKLTGTITNAQLAGSITQDKIVSLPTTKLTGTITNGQLAGSITEDKITSLPTTKLTGTITNDQLAGSIADGKIVGISASKLIGTVTNGQLAGSITSDKILSLAASKVSGTLDISTIPAAVLTDVNASSPVTVSGSGRSRTIGINTASFALASHTHSQYAANGRYDTSFAGDHLGHGGHSHFINTASTKKLKKEISDYSIDLEKLFLLQPKQFKYRNQARNFSKNREWDYGYIAEEALEIGVEEIVGYDEKGEVDSINYGLLSVFVLELVKKQQSEIDLLSEEIKRLKEKE